MKRFFPMLVLTGIILFAGCKKEKEAEPVCRLFLITPAYTAITSFYYDDKGRIKTIRKGDYNRNFEYKGDSLVVIQRIGAGFHRKRGYKLNANGLPFSMREYLDELNKNWINYQFEYNGTELAKVAITTSNTGATVFSYKYTWVNGNLSSDFDGVSPSSQEYEYDMDKPCIPGDAMSIESPWPDMDIEIVRNKNRLKRITHLVASPSPATGQTYSMDYSYTYDSQGKITSVTKKIDTQVAAIYDLIYTCN